MKAITDMNKSHFTLLIALFLLCILPFIVTHKYLIYVIILIFIWAFVATAWSYAGSFGMISLGHGAFFGIGAYTAAILFNQYGLTPWVGMLIGGAIAAVAAAVIGYSCFKYGVISHYFSVGTLVIAELSFLVVIALKDAIGTGGRLGLTVLRTEGSPFLFFQFENQIYYYFITLIFLTIALYIRHRLNTSKFHKALTALREDEEAALSLGINVVKYKTLIFSFSAFMTALGGTLYVQFTMFADPATCAGVILSLSIVFKAILGGMYTLWGPTVGALIIVAIEEFTRQSLGSAYVSYSQILYGILVIIFIMYLPEGIHGRLAALDFKKKLFKLSS